MVAPTHATTYVFGEDGITPDLTFYGTNWTSANTYIIAGDCFIPNGFTLTIQSGVQVYFDYDYGSDVGSPMYPTIRIDGQMSCIGTPAAPVWFINLTGTNSGEFGGIKVGNGSTYGGHLLANYTVFQYGGAYSALINLDDDAQVTMIGCHMRLSATKGIQTVGDDVVLSLTDCYADSNGATGIDISNPISALDLTSVAAIGNGGDGIFWDDNPVLHVVISNAYVGDNANHGMHIEMFGGGPGGPELELQNCQFYQQSNGYGLYIDLNYGVGNFYAGSCAFAGNEFGLLIDHLSPYAEGVEDTRILNSVFWDNATYGLIVGLDDNIDTEEDNPVYLQNCIFGSQPHNIYSTADMPFRGDINALDEDNNINAWFPDNTQIWGGFELASEIPDDPYEIEPPYDLHIRWNSPQTGDPCLINQGESDLGCGIDPDGSPTDLGLFGGELGDDFTQFDFYRPWARDYEFYIRVGDVGQTYSESGPSTTLYSTIYRNYSTWDTYSDPADVFTIEAGTTIEFVGTGYFYIGGYFYCNGTEEQPVRFYGIDDNPWWGISNSQRTLQSSGRMTYTTIEDVTSSNRPGLSLTSIHAAGNPPTLFYLQNVDVTGGHGYGFTLWDDDIRLVDCSASQNSYGGCETTLDNARSLIISGCDFSGNGNALASSAGLICHGAYASPSIGYKFLGDPQTGTPYYDHFTRICNNQKYGIYISGGGDPILKSPAGPTLDKSYRTNTITGNANTQIYLSAAGCTPVMYGGHNDIYSGNPNVKALHNGTGSTFDARDNYWGTDNPAPVYNQLFDGNTVTYSPWDIQRNTWDYANEIDLMEMALGMYLSDSAEAIAKSVDLFKAIAADPQYTSNRFAALNFLRDACASSGGDLSALRDWYLDYAAKVEDETLCKMATRWAIWCYADAGDYKKALEEFQDQQTNAKNLVDSLWAAIDIVSAEFLSGMEVDMPGAVGDGTGGFPEVMNDLSDRLERAQAEALERNDSPAAPKSFDLGIAYPNPFNPDVAIPVRVNRTSRLSLSVYSIDGRLVDSHSFGPMLPGNHLLDWQANNAASGCYLLRINSGFDEETSSVQLIH